MAVTNKEFFDWIKSEIKSNPHGWKARSRSSISPGTVDQIRKVLKRVGLKTSRYKEEIDVYKVSWFFFALFFADSTNPTALAKWIETEFSLCSLNGFHAVHKIERALLDNSVDKIWTVKGHSNDCKVFLNKDSFDSYVEQEVIKGRYFFYYYTFNVLGFRNNCV